MKLILLFICFAFMVTISNLTVNCSSLANHSANHDEIKIRHNPDDRYRFMALIYSGNCYHVCSGIFLSSNLVLTTADCVQSPIGDIRVYENRVNYFPDCTFDVDLNPVEEKFFAIKEGTGVMQKPKNPAYRPVLLKLSPFNYRSSFLPVINSEVESELNSESNLEVIYPGYEKRASLTRPDSPHDCPEDHDLICGKLNMLDSHLNAEKSYQPVPAHCLDIRSVPLMFMSRKVKNGQTFLVGLSVDSPCKLNKISRFIDLSPYKSWINEQVTLLASKEIDELSTQSLNLEDENGLTIPTVSAQSRSIDRQTPHLPYGLHPTKPSTFGHSTDSIANNINRQPNLYIDEGSKMKFIPNCTTSFNRDNGRIGDGNCLCHVQSKEINISLDPETVNILKKQSSHLRETLRQKNINIDINNNNNNGGGNINQNKGKKNPNNPRGSLEINESHQSHESNESRIPHGPHEPFGHSTGKEHINIDIDNNNNNDNDNGPKEGIKIENIINNSNTNTNQNRRA